MTDRNQQLKREIVNGIDSLEYTEHLLRIRRLVLWCLGKEMRGG